ncbi:hypothetical protein [Kitasatospora sp. NPDC086791]|uniref:hypothetical protein n=1 Tax=Kitasatospora sp. NPDC086791 TaxID=3155178 RepID=UPI003435964A
MDLLTYKAVETGPDTPKNQGFAHRAWIWLLTLSPTVVTLMITLSVGMGMAAAQISLLAVLIPMAIFWGLTVVAIIGVVARWMTPGPGRHRATA